MTLADVLVDAFGRVRSSVSAVLDGLGDEQLQYQPDAEANTIAWLVWHLTRVQDDHVADAAGMEQVWAAGGWRERFDLALEPLDTGYGHTPEQVTRVRAPAELLDAYNEAVHEQTVGYVRTLGEADLDRIVDTRWDPPVSLGVRLVSVVDDDLEHVGQAAYVRGLAERR
ncbi:MAG: mycothiol transferase [Acidimicrobiales bacterium]|jgi:hypothetical protein